MVRWVLLLLLAAVLAGCGGGGRSHASCTQQARERALAKLDRDLAALRKAARVPAKNKLAGGPAINRATDRFLHDVDTAPLDNLTRNRLIDHAAEAVVSSCQQCFQALEADRPIPAIASGNRGRCSSRS